MKAFENYDFHKLTLQVLKALRGKFTQKQMSLNLGYSYNQWHKWESGQKRLLWNELESILKNLKIDISTEKVYVTGRPEAGQLMGGMFALSIIDCFGGPSSSLAQKRLKLSKSKIHRLKDSDTDVEVAFVFQCLGSLSSMLPMFVKSILRNSTPDSLTFVFDLFKRQVSLEARFPWLSAIEACLEFETYKKLKRHSDAFIAEQLGISVKQAKFGLQMLEENRAIVWQKTHFHLDIKRVDLGGSIVDSDAFSKFWTEICLQRYNTPNQVPRSQKGFSSRVTPISNEAYQQVHALRFKFYDDLQKIYQSDGDRPKSRAMVMIMHIFDDLEIREINPLK